MSVRSAWMAFAVLALMASGCSGGTTSTPTATSTRPPTASVTPTPTAPAKAAATAAPTLVATVTNLGAPTFRIIESVQACLDAVAQASTLELPRQIVSVTPASVHDGDSVTITAVGYRPNSALEVRVFIPGTNRISQPLAQTLSTEAGRATATFPIRSVRLLNAVGDPNMPLCLGVLLWSPTEVGGAISFVVPER